jgi:hypothetical protein
MSLQNGSIRRPRGTVGDRSVNASWRLAWLEVECKLCKTRASFRLMQSAGPTIADLDTGSGAEMPLMPNAALLAACTRPEIRVWQILLQKS